ncbi:MAG: tRNA lysidine(34) synthetase TilS [Rickettsiales bacterium]|jgi:tRNA(Ile)-lysidine synthase|nr:tRNA lysidine(34) synthetase TilS [Rickettsiales bacterium]
MNKDFLSSVSGLRDDYPNETLAVAVSGGADSMALLHWLKDVGAKIVALTVDHKLRPESADEAEYVAKICKKLGVPHRILEWTGQKPKTGIEEAARAARYELMLDYCKKNNIGVLATAHQADDQIETFLMNLGRGSGIYGLAGMRGRQERDGVVIFRPLLGTSRAELQKYCDDNGIRHFNDAMNDDERYLRVRIRKNRAKLGISDERILLAIENMSRAREYIESEARKLARKIPVEIDADLLLNAAEEIRFRALSLMLGEEGHPLRLEKIKNAFAKMDAGDAKFTLAGFNVRKQNGKIRIWKEGTKWKNQRRR